MGKAEDLAVRARGLRTPWERRSREAGWDAPGEWWTPAVDAVCAAYASGNDLVGPCACLGGERARAGVGIGLSLEDLSVFTALAGWRSPPLALLRALAEGWAEAEPEDCLDPLTGLATADYLRIRLGELYRRTGGDAPPAVDHRLVLVALDPAADPWRRAARLIVLAHELRRFFTRGESVCLLGRSRIAVVAPDTEELGGELDELRRGPVREHGAVLWAVALPPAYEDALSLVGGWERPR